MEPVYKLKYFNLTGFGDAIRFLFAHGGIDFEDIRIEGEAWLKIKPNTPFGQLPVLEINGRPYHQSIAICRYVAGQVKLAGKDDLEDLEIDGIVDTLKDLCLKISDAKGQFSGKDLNAPLPEVFINETVSYYLERIENMAKKNNGYLAVGRLTWADLWFVAILNYFNLMYRGDIIAEYPTLKALEHTVLELPNIKAYIENRPKTDDKHFYGLNN